MPEPSTNDAGKAAPEILPTREGYDRWSELYDVDENPLIHLETPVVRRLLGDVTGMNLLDVGCGTGRWSHQLAGAGAKVTAFDFSEGMLQKARAKNDANPVHFIQHDVADPFPFADATFDRLTCCLVIDHVADLIRLFSEMRRVCRPEGCIVVSSMHPAMMLKGTQARFHDPATGREIRPKSEPHQLCDYVNAIRRGGLRIETMEEHLVDDELAGRVPRAMKYLHWPMLVAFKLRPETFLS